MTAVPKFGLDRSIGSAVAKETPVARENSVHSNLDWRDTTRSPKDCWVQIWLKSVNVEGQKCLAQTNKQSKKERKKETDKTG